MAQKVIIAARQYQNDHNYDSSNFIFALDGQIPNHECINKFLRKYCKILKIPYRSSHSARKSFASTCLGNNIGLNSVRKYMGHADERTTLRNYCFDQNLPDEKRKKFEAALDF